MSIPVWIARVKQGVALLALGIAASCTSSPKLLEPGFIGEIREANRKLENRFGAGDLLGVANLYADDAILLGPEDYRVEAREGIDAHWSDIEHPISWRLTVEDVGGTPETAYQYGTSRMTTLREGREHTSVTRFLLLWRRDEAGNWRIRLDAFWPREE